MITTPAVSLVVIGYKMARELPRTILSLSPAMQKGIAAEDVELIVVDNGSPDPVPGDLVARYGARGCVIRIEDARVSPAHAINLGIARASAPLIGVCIDGARMASPGLLRAAREAARVHPRTVIASLGFHLGPDVQMRSVKSGYDTAREDALLESCAWTEDGYRLFAISVFAGSSASGWFAPMLESNALFMPQILWRELGGYDESFEAPGGGLVNLDTYRRACALPLSQHVTLLGEGTFHQVHGGVATNALESPWQAFHEEYVRVRGEPFSPPPPVDTVYIGRIPEVAWPSLEWSMSKRIRTSL